MGWTGENHVQLGYPDDSADNTVEASIVSLADGIIVAAGLDNDWYNVTFRAFRADGAGGLEGGPVAYYNGYPDNLPTAANPGAEDPTSSLAFDDINHFVQISDYVFAWIGESNSTFDLTTKAPDVAGEAMIAAQFLTVNPTTLAITRTGRAFYDYNEFYADEATGAAWDGKLVLMTGSAAGDDVHYLAICEPAGDTMITYVPTPVTNQRMGPIAVTGDKVLFSNGNDPSGNAAWYYVNLLGDGPSLIPFGPTIVNVDPAPQPATLTIGGSWVDDNDSTYATIVHNTNPSDLNGFAHARLYARPTGDVTVTVRFGLTGTQPGPGNATSVVPTFNIVDGSNLTREGASGYLAGEAIAASFPDAQAMTGPQEWTFTFPEADLPAGDDLYVTMTMPNTTTDDLMIYKITLSSTSVESGGGGLVADVDFGENYCWAWFTKTLADGRVAVIVTKPGTPDGTGDPIGLVVFDADLAGGYDGPYEIAPSAKNVGWTGGWYSNVRSIDVFPNGNLLIGYLVGNNQPWLAEVDPDDGTIIRQYQPPHNTNITNCWNYEIATFKTNNTDFLLMWAGYSDAGWETYRLLVAGGGESFGHIAADPFQETFENGADGERITTFNTNFPGIDWDEDPFANDAEVYFTTDSHSGALAAVGEGYSLHYPYTLDEAVTISGDPESGTFWMKVDYSAFSTEEALFSIHTGQTGDQLVSANERLTLYVFNSESNLQWEDHSYDTPVLVPDDTWFKVEWSVEGPAYTIKITDEAENVYLDIAKDMDDDGLQSPYYKFAHVTFYLPPGVTLDDINNEAPPAPATAVWWWDGEALQPAEFLGWWASGTLEDAEIPGWWDGDTIEPLETE